MEWLSQSWTRVRAQLEGLSGSQKWAIATTLALGLLLVGIAVIVAGQPQRVAIGAFAGGRSEEVLARLVRSGIDARREGSQILVPVSQRDEALVVLVESELLSPNAAEAFNELIARQSPWQTTRQSERDYLIAKQQVLSQIISKMKGVRAASVILSMPRDQGFGAAYVRPSASVTIWMEGGGRVSDTLVDSVARLVASSVAEMTPQNVSVTDANHGRTRTIEDEDDVLPTQTLELIHRLESYYREKINGVLSYIPGVIVAVNVQVDPVQSQQEVTWERQKNQPLVNEMTESISRREVSPAAEPGARPNTGLEIPGSSGAGTEEKIERTETTFNDPPLTREVHRKTVGHQPEQINVTINVPRRYFVQIYQAANPSQNQQGQQGQQAITDQAIQPVVNAQLAQIQAQVEPLIQAEAPGVVRVHMIPDETLMPPAAPATAGGVTAMLAADWLNPTTLSLGALAMVALAMMLWMVRSATRPEPLPSVEELAGLPPTLVADEDLVGEAEESEAPLAGVELGEDDLRSRKIAQQISELIKANPHEAGGLLGKWVRTEE
ncbi:MAG TPA: hypothetical protein VF184_10940 [Phycisphaeraceae bacterium]